MHPWTHRLNRDPPFFQCRLQVREREHTVGPLKAVIHELGRMVRGLRGNYEPDPFPKGTAGRVDFDLEVARKSLHSDQRGVREDRNAVGTRGAGRVFQEKNVKALFLQPRGKLSTCPISPQHQHPLEIAGFRQGPPVQEKSTIRRSGPTTR